MKLLLINSLKGLNKKKVQMLGIIMMVFLSTGIYTMMNRALDRLESRYYTYIEEQNIEDFSFVGVIDYKKDFTVLEVDSLLETKLKMANLNELEIINTYKKCINNFDLEECSNEFMLTNISNIFTKYEASQDKIDEKIKLVASNNNFSYEKELTKIISDEKYLIKLMTYNENKKINKPYLVKGEYPIHDNEVTVLERFALKNNLEVGDNFKIGNNNYKISGIVYASDYIYPIISINTPLFDEKYHTVVFTNQSTFNSINGLKEELFSAKFNYKTDPKHRIEFKINQDTGKIIGPLSKMFEKEKSSISVNMGTMIRSLRVDAIQVEFKTNKLFAEYFLYLLLGISVFIIVIVMKKRIDDERLQIGVLKSLGYKSTSIATSYLVYPIIGSLIGGIFGSLFGSLVSGFLTKLYVSYYTLPIDKLAFNSSYLLKCTLVPMILLTVLSYFIALFMLRHKPLYLLKEGSNLKVNWFNKFMVKVTSKFKFKTRFKYSLAARSLGKLIIVSLTSFFTGMLIVLTLIGINLFSSMIDKTFEGLDFKYMVSYITPVFNNNESVEEDYLTEIPLKATKVIVNGKERVLKEEASINIDGINKKVNLLELKDKNKVDLIPKLGPNKIIINRNIAGILEVDINDKIVFTYNNKDISYKIVGINESFMGLLGYVEKSSFNQIFNMPSSYYNKVFSNLDKYSQMNNLSSEELTNIGGVFSIKDLRRNMETTMEAGNASVYVVISFAAVMALIIIGVIANIVVEENKKTISLMKVMGYDNKKISAIVLNIYTPFVIIAYFLSIPCMIAILKKIIANLVSDMSLAIPISLNPLMAVVGLIGLLISYYIAINLSRRVLNRVPLAVALKRE
ncbi:MAG: ABC transporter permease [Bacilli bacterium]